VERRQLVEVELDEFDEPKPMFGQWPLGIEPLAFDGVVLDEPDPVELELLEPSELDVAEPAAFDAPELLVAELGVVELDVAATATVVPTPAKTPVRSRPAAMCLMRSFMTQYLVSCFPWRGWGSSLGADLRRSCETDQATLRTCHRSCEERITAPQRARGALHRCFSGCSVVAPRLGGFTSWRGAPCARPA